MLRTISVISVCAKQKMVRVITPINLPALMTFTYFNPAHASKQGLCDYPCTVYAYLDFSCT